MRTLPIAAGPIEYDLVILSGASLEAAQLAAQLAVHYQARVALVAPATAPTSTALPQICAALGRLAATQTRLAAFMGRGGPVDWSADWSAITAATETIAQRQQVRQDPAQLAALGVDYITGSGAFYRKPRLGFEVNGRQLRSRAYLLALGPTCRPSEATSPPFLEPGFDRRDCLTPATLAAALAAGTVGKTIALIGANAIAVSLAQSLQRLGFEVILLTAQANLLSTIDPEAAGLVQALLEAEGVQIWVQTRVNHRVNDADQTRLQVIEGTVPREVVVDTVVWAAEPEFDLAAAEVLNLAATQVQWSRAGIAVDDRQRTHQRQIYACQDPLLLPQVIKNALFPWAHRVETLPVAIVDCDPPIASVGLTEAAAQACYGTDLQVVRQPFYPLAQFQDAPIGFCKLLVRRNGTIVGGQIVGPAATELAHTLALAIQSGLPLQKFAGLDLSGTQARSAIFSQLAQQWQQSRPQTDWLEVWFDWCRSIAR